MMEGQVNSLSNLSASDELGVAGVSTLELVVYLACSLVPRLGPKVVVPLNIPR